MNTKGRSSRVAELIREEIAKLISNGLKDPRIGFVSVMAVRMSPDLRYANTYVSLFGGESERKSSLAGLRSSAGWIRREVGRHLRMRHTPEIRFFPDTTLDEVYHLEEVFQEIHEEQQHTPMLRLSLKEMVEELQKADSLLLLSHENPDGDAVGSLLAMRILLLGMGKTRVYTALDGAVPRIYQMLPGAKGVLNPESDVPAFDTAVMLDCSGMDRLGGLAEWLEPGDKLLVLDHHREEGPSGSLGLIEPAYAATGELLVDLFDAAGVPISREAAECLYVAQATDTGGYRFSNTTARSHEIAARLIGAGIDNAALSDAVFNLMSRTKFELLRRVLDRAELRCGGALCVSWVSPEDFAATGALKEDTDGLINYLRQVEGVRVAALFTATEPGRCKVSLRSVAGFDSAEFLRAHGGGGHSAAAGATFELPLTGAVEELTHALEAALADENGGDKA
ncbi:MAG: 30S ribosome-binding factor RbfA [Candidatus Hydrogenedentes bacterium]|nr:30S ribosome-binding factor RbfA [Candidatus Hydrogenedentota bacterium]